ncbi:MAG: M57 family metalloprotease [Lewinella sp.]
MLFSINRESVLFFSMLLLVLSACTKSEEGLLKADDPAVLEQVITDEISSHFATELDLSGAKPITVNSYNGTRAPHYLVDGDILIPEKEYLRITSGDKHYRSSNLADNCQIITIAGSCGSFPPEGDALTLQLKLALSWAINQYNGLHRELGIKFRTLPCDQYDEADIKVFFDESLSNVVIDGNSFNIPASAGLPDANGNPYPEIRIGPLLLDLGDRNAEMYKIAMVHEIGHCIGFRHTDWFDRSSCGQNTSEPDEFMGSTTVHIPGTPVGHTDFGSVMRACALSFSVPNPYFTNMDLRALKYMYPQRACDLVKPDETGIWQLPVPDVP